MDPTEALATARRHPLLAVLEPRALEATVAGSRLVHYRAKRTFLKEGHPPEQAYLLLQGTVRVYHCAPNGSELLLKLLRAPALFGEMEVMAERPFLEHVTTLGPADLLEVPRRVFMQLLEQRPAFARAVALDLAARLCIAADNLKALAFCDLDTRLANLLLDYAQIFGVPDGGAITLDLALTQDGMSRDLSVTRQAVASALARLRTSGVLDKQSGRYVIRDLDVLRRSASATLSLSFSSERPGNVRRPRR